MANVVYLACAATAFLCAVLLLRGYARSRSRLLLWSGVCFAILTINNALVFVDLTIFPNVSLFLWRNLAALVAIVVLLVGLIWEAR